MGKQSFSTQSGGETPVDKAETITLFGEKAGRYSINQRRKAGVAFVSEERLGHGAAPAMSLTDNIVLTRATSDEAMHRNGQINRRLAQDIREKVCADFDVRRSSDNPPAGSLSGGNLQKFIMGREIGSNPSLLIINQPTWGVDAGAAQNIRQTLIDCAGKRHGGTGHLPGSRRDFRDRRRYCGAV